VGGLGGMILSGLFISGKERNQRGLTIMKGKHETRQSHFPRRRQRRTSSPDGHFGGRKWSEKTLHLYDTEAGEGGSVPEGGGGLRSCEREREEGEAFFYYERAALTLTA